MKKNKEKNLLIQIPRRFMKKRTHILKIRFLFILLALGISSGIAQPLATANYAFQTGTLGSGYDWIDCSAGTNIVTGDDSQSSISWPFTFTFYGNTYTTANSLSVAANGFIRLDGVAAGNNYSASNAYDLTASATNFGQIISLAMYDNYVGRTATSWVKYLVTGSAPYRVLTIEYNDLNTPYYSSTNFTDVEVSFYETTNKVVLKLGDDNITTAGVDMGIHSGVSGYFHKWQEVENGTNNTWIEYSLPIQVESSLGTPIAYYQNLKTAFDNINSGKHQGNITIKVNESTLETASAVLNASGAGSASYTNVTIFPTSSGKSITGSIAAPLIDLNGADNVIVDGRVNATGTSTDLSIINSSTSSTANTSTFRFINDASNNAIRYCTIKGSETATSSGIIYFSTTTSSAGNDGNTISNNDITSAATSARPVNAIFSLGTSGKENSENSISNNSIFDFFRPASNSNGVYLSTNNTAWTVNDNDFYETTSFASTGTFTYYAIQVNDITGGGFSISNNHIGGSNIDCGGSAWVKTNTKSNLFYAISLNVGNDIPSSIQNNTIQNLVLQDLE
jgi:hypothetical protein